MKPVLFFSKRFCQHWVIVGTKKGGTFAAVPSLVVLLLRLILRCIVYCLCRFRHQIKSLFCLWVGHLFVFALFLGCQVPSSPEQTLEQFLQAVEKNDMTQVWVWLDSSSQKSWSRLAHRVGYQDGKQLFLSGDIWKMSRLRRDPKLVSQNKGNQTVFFFRDELEQPVRVVLIRENASWRVVLLAPPLTSSFFPTTQPSR